MLHWIKRYQDHSSLISNNDKSWSKTDLDNMVGASTGCGNYYIAIASSNVSDFWQSETYEAVVLENHAVLIKLNIKRKVISADKFLLIDGQSQTQMTLSLYSEMPKVVFEKDTIVSVPKGWTGKWLVVELDLRNKQFSYSIEDDKY